MTQRGWAIIGWGLLAAALGCYPAMAGEHGGQEHGGQEHGSAEHGGSTTAAPAPSSSNQWVAPVAEIVQPSADAVRQTIREYIRNQTEEAGVFTVDDDVTGKARTLTLVGVHQRVGKTGEFYYACADMKDAGSGELLDLDFDVQAGGQSLDVVDVRIHKAGGKARYTYDSNDQRIPLR